MTTPRLVLLTSLTMVAFAGNSLLCRAALRDTAIDPATFTSIRLLAGAVALLAIAQLRRGYRGQGSWRAAGILFVYAAAFSFAYVSLSAATGPLLLFGAVQTTMIGYGFWRGERMGPVAVAGLMLALGGLVGLLLPGLTAPPLAGSLLMLGAGIGWGIYSLIGRGSGDPLRDNAGNFLRALPFTVILSLALLGRADPDLPGIGLAVASGALASGLGYAVWYTVLPWLRSTRAGIVQLSVPVIAALGGVVLLGERVTPRLLMASAAILGGIALVIQERREAITATQGAGEEPA